MSLGEIRSVRTVNGLRYGVFDARGRLQGALSLNRDDAESKLETLLTRERVRRDSQTRPCMCCEKTFLSEGKHNRLCDTCRTKFY